MHDMRIAFDVHKFANLYATRRTHFADVVTGEIDKHDMFGTLFDVVLQFFSQLLITLPVNTAWTGASDGTDGHFIVFEAHEQFR